VVDIGDIIGMLGDGPPKKKAVSPAALFLQEMFDFIKTPVVDEEPEKPNYLRASGLYKLCARREAIYSVFPDQVPGREMFTAGQQMTFDVGHAVHAWVQNKYLGPMGKLWGHWFCNKCFSITHTGLMPKKCKDCGTGRTIWIAFEYEGLVERANVDNLLYVERSLVDNDLGLTAHPDGMLYASDLRDIQQVFELKTTSSDNLDKLTKAGKPKPEHVVQTHAYMHLTQLRETYIVYFDKGKQCDWKWSLETGPVPGPERLRIFHIEFDDEMWAEIVVEIREYWKARELAHRESPVSADVAAFKRKCKSPTGPTARTCPARDKCFALRSFPK
jgi:hypothetical protein